MSAGTLTKTYWRGEMGWMLRCYHYYPAAKRERLWCRVEAEGRALLQLFREGLSLEEAIERVKPQHVEFV